MSKHRIPNEKWMEFIDEIATQITEITFGEDTFTSNGMATTKGLDRLTKAASYGFTEEAQDFYNETYDEVETLLENTLDITNDKPEYYES